MGKQIRFFMFPGDEQRFVDYVCQELSAVLIMCSTTKPKPHIIKLPLASANQNEELGTVLIWQPSSPISRKHIDKLNMREYSSRLKDYIETGEVKYYVNNLYAPVIELSRSFVLKNVLTQGRIWAEMSIVDKDGYIKRKPETFERLYDKIARWIRRNAKKIKGIDGYIFDEALEWYLRGGKLG